ncbi:MAG: dephospho-CoA kinase [Spirochaetia bacterium]|nr:dephospho-CoA kinase [Spirochaetia bacterium]
MAFSMEIESLPEIHWDNKFFVIGLTGGIASGKSTTAEIFQNAGVQVISADMLAKEVFETEEIQSALRNHFGESVIEKNQVSRLKIAEKVFNQPEELSYLNSLIHPEVKKKFNQMKQSLEPGEILVYDVPLLFETNQDHEYDLTLTIHADFHIRKKRALSRSGWTEEEFMQRERAQLPLEEKIERSTACIENNGNQDELKRKIFSLIQRIQDAKN